MSVKSSKVAFNMIGICEERKLNILFTYEHLRKDVFYQM
jgi:hypothetical protein